MPQPDVAHQGKVTILAAAVAFVIVGILFYALVGLIARRLNGYIFINMSNVFVPLFIVFVSASYIKQGLYLLLSKSFFLCCSGCCLPCLLRVSAVSNLDEHETQVLVDANRRITASGESDASGSGTTAFTPASSLAK
ncbi:hypothetical protein PS15m_000034 [Mucor circinelloides]